MRSARLKARPLNPSLRRTLHVSRFKLHASETLGFCTQPNSGRLPRAMFRVIFHLDMDAFYASVEQRDKPALRGQPVIVGAPASTSSRSATWYWSCLLTFVYNRYLPEGLFLLSRQPRRILVG